jgi:CheY-like chemotaxis protein
VVAAHTATAPTEEFVSAVKDALEHLYDPAHLGSHALAELLLARGGEGGPSRVFALRQTLLDFIDRLNPGAAVPPTAPARRAHRLLELRFVHALPFREVVTDLGLSQAQYHRDQRHALQALAQLLWEHAREQEVGAARPAARPEGAVDLRDVMSGVVETLGPVARDRGVRLSHRSSPEPFLVAGDRTILRQLLISLVSSVLEASRGAEVVLSGSTARGVPTVRVTRRGGGAGLAGAPGAEQGLADARELLHGAGGELAVAEGEDGLTIEARLGSHRRSLLVIDDNVDIVQMIRRFLVDHACDVHSAASVDEGLAAARSRRPDLILLDIMIPERDGWDGLQALKHDPDTEHIPVLVCTVLRESQLAAALGADGFVRKPLTLPALLEALERWTPGRLGRRQGVEDGLD